MKEKSLKEIDKFVIGKMKETTDKAEILSKVKTNDPICRTCNGQLIQLVPLVEMGELKLYECSACTAREYL